MTYIVKQLKSDQLDSFKELMDVFAKAFEDPESYQDKPPTSEYLRDLLGKEHVIALAAFSGDVVVAGLVAYVLDKFEQVRKEIYIYDLAVDQDHRRQGIATMLINELRRIAKERGAYVIYVQADVGDDPAIALYESLGIREDVHHFDITI